MTDITVSRELLRQAIEALDEADNVLTSSMFAEAATALRAALDAEPAPVQEQQPICVVGSHWNTGGGFDVHSFAELVRAEALDEAMQVLEFHGFDDAVPYVKWAAVNGREKK